MNLLLLNEEDFIGSSRVQVSGRRVQHLQKVLQSQKGDVLRAGVLGGLLGHATVLEMRGQQVELEFVAETAPPPGIPVNLFMALPRPKNLHRLLQTLTQLGVKHVHFFHSYRVEKSFWTSDYLLPEVTRKALLLGLEQARDTILPEIHFHRWFKPFVQDHLPELSHQGDRWVAHPYTETAFSTPSVGQKVNFVFGPEGGLIDYEVDLLVEAGFQAVHLGPRVLKVEVAVTSALGGWLGSR